MAPVKIKHVVSYTSQDPKYPVENLLLKEGIQPWLSCPQDRSRQLKAELQLEQASHIGYIDVGNCGSAFLQIDVGRSSWPLDLSYLTLLPSTTLMTPADAKLDKNRSGVRMFKEGDFLASARGEKWDRIRLTCSQPFHKHAQFGLSFIRIRTPLDTDDSKAGLASSPSQAPPEVTGSPWLSSTPICRTFFPEVPSATDEEAELKSCLQQLDSTSSPGARSPACMSRPARMVLKAARASKRVFALGAASAPPSTESKENGQPQSAENVGQASPALRSKQKLSARRGRVKTRRGRGLRSTTGRSVAASPTRLANVSRREGRGRRQEGRLRKTEDKEEEEENWLGERAVAVGTCPICAGCFPAHLLPVHASSCGEENDEVRSSSSSPLSWEEPPEAWVHCPICQFRFPADKVEGHASTCGETAQPFAHSSSWLWVE